MQRPNPSKNLSRRRVSAPATTPFGPRAQEAPVEALFLHPSVKIVSFTAQVRAFPLDPESAREEAGTLSSHSQTERTIAVGSLRIYRAPGSVAFLSCGAALQPILPKSQCWCIDENNTTYVLQVRRPTFWRVELPVSTAEYQSLASDLKEVLGQVLQFEKTYCPFRRTFSVELPEQPETPVKKRPWTPKHFSGTTKSPNAGLHGDADDVQSSALSQITQLNPADSPSDLKKSGQSDAEGFVPQTEGTIQPTSLDVELETISPERHPEVPPTTTVTSIVDDIHERFGRFSTTDSLRAFRLGSTSQKTYTDEHEPPSQTRRHSFDTFMKPSFQVNEESPSTEPLSPFHHDGLKLEQNVTDSRPSPHASQSTKSIGTLGELSRKPRSPHSRSFQGTASYGSTTDDSRSMQVPTSGTADHPGAEPDTTSSWSAGGEPSGPPQCLRGAKDATESRVTVLDTTEATSRQNDPRLPVATRLGPRDVSGILATSTLSASSTSSRNSSSGVALSPALRMNTISKIYDVLLLPLAYIIALALRAVAGVFARRELPTSTIRKHGDQAPSFLQYSEDELTE